MNLIAKIKHDLARHPAKAGVLALLFVMMIFMSVRAVVQLQPQTAVASTDIPTAFPVHSVTAPASDDTEAEARIRESKELWRQLQLKRGIDVAYAFSFDSSLYPLDPTRKVVTAPVAEIPDAAPVVPVVDNTAALLRATEARIREQALALSVKSTTVSGAGKPWAIVNQQLVSLGDQIKGFEITAIRAREVEFKKEGVTVAVKMPDDFRGQ